MEAATTVVNPAPGPETPNCDPLTTETTMPPIMPDKIPAYKGAPDANAMPRQSGSATKKTDKPAGRSCFSQMSR